MIKNFFKTDSERELWIKLNAERQIEWEKGLKYFDTKSQTYKPTHQALNHRSMEEALRISRGQLRVDEETKDKPRYSLEELLTLTIDKLNEIQKSHHLEWCKKFKKIRNA
jgi:hypothetical protein